MSKAKQIIALLIVFAVQIGMVSSVIFANTWILRQGQAVSFLVEPVDPHDPFRGKYVDLNMDTLVKKDPKATFQYEDTAYILIKMDAKGFGRFDQVVAKKPTDGIYIKTKVFDPAPLEEGMVYVENPFQRFYIEEKYAAKAEEAYFANAAENKVHIQVKILNGKAVIQELYFNNQKVENYLNKMAD